MGGISCVVLCFSVFIAVILIVNVLAHPTCENGTYPPNEKTKADEYIFNLDLPPERRWDAILNKKAANVRNLLVIFREFFGSKILDFIDKYAPKLLSGIPKEYALEMTGIANASKLHIGEAVMFNLFYEFFTVCTSVVARDSRGELYHVRNMDFGLFMGWNESAHTWSITEALRPMVITLNVQKSGKTVYKAATFAGYIGVLSAVKKGLFSFTINERFAFKGGWIGLIEWLLMGERDQQWLSVLTRSLMLNGRSFSDAKALLSTSKLLAPAYFILGGIKGNEGCVITRARTEVLNTRCLNDTHWYVVQTNYDYWKAAPFYDDRRTPAIYCLNEIKNVSLPSLFNVLSTRPVLNKLTTYTALMKVDSGFMEIWKRKCPDPCPPW